MIETAFLDPIIIMIAIPLALIGISWAMLLAGRHFCMPASMGMVLLAAIGGLFVSTLLTLVYVPLFYTLIEKLKKLITARSRERYMAGLI